MLNRVSVEAIDSLQIVFGISLEGTQNKGQKFQKGLFYAGVRQREQVSSKDSLYPATEQKIRKEVLY